jgi:hypothetical protein
MAMTSSRATDLAWITVGAAILVVLTVVAVRFHDERDVGEQLTLKARKVDLVGRMRTGLASAAEAEKSAVLAVTDEDSRAFADRARALSADVEHARQDLSPLLQAEGTQDERDLLTQFSRAFVELQRIDTDILRLAVKNTNLKAYALAYGPAAEALGDMGAALSRLGAGAGGAAAERPQAYAASPEGTTAPLLAAAAQIAALRLQTLLPPHIAEQRDETMDEIEARMAEEERTVRANLDALAALQRAIAEEHVSGARAGRWALPR